MNIDQNKLTIAKEYHIQFMEFVRSVFPNAGEQQINDLEMVWYAGAFAATNLTAKTQDLTGVHVVAFDKLREHNDVCERMIGK